MCVLGWLNHHCVRFQREVDVPFWTVTGHPLHLNTVIIKAPFSFSQNPKFFAQYPSHRILRHMHGILNVDEKKLIA